MRVAFGPGYDAGMVAIAKRIQPPDYEYLLLPNASWELYEQLLAGAGNKRLTYDEGVLEIMSPLPIHETIKKMLGRMIELMAVELNVPMEGLGPTTFKSRVLAKGLEPDECYYVAHADAIRGVKSIDLNIHPPPDLAIEVDITSDSLPRQPIYERLGIAELWRFDGETLHVLHLVGGKYESREESIAFPGLKPAELLLFVAAAAQDGQTPTMRRFQAWVRAGFAHP